MNQITLTVPEIVLLVSIVAWFVRLEAKVLFQGKDHGKLEEVVKAKDKLLWEKFDSLRLDVTKILEAVSFLKGQSAQREQHEKTI